MKSLPSGPWEVLLERALRLIDDIQRHGALADSFWTFGGGTVLMFRYGHRLSKDIDIFVPDPQYLGYVTPRLSDPAASLIDMTKKTQESYRSAVTGRYVKEHYGKTHPDTTVKERTPAPQPPKKK